MGELASYCLRGGSKAGSIVEPRAGFEPAACRFLARSLQGGCLPVLDVWASARLSHRGAAD